MIHDQHDISIFWGPHRMETMEQDLRDLCDQIRKGRMNKDGYISNVPDSCMIMGILKVYCDRYEKTPEAP